MVRTTSSNGCNKNYILNCGNAIFKWWGHRTKEYFSYIFSLKTSVCFLTISFHPLLSPTTLSLFNLPSQFPNLPSGNVYWSEIYADQSEIYAKYMNDERFLWWESKVLLFNYFLYPSYQDFVLLTVSLP